MLATLFIPGIVVLVPLFLTVLDLPLFGTSLVDTYWAVWLPAGANAFNVLLVKRFMDGLPRERVRGGRRSTAPARSASSSTWRCRCRGPILGVVSLLAMLNAWKDYLWPLVVLPNPEIQPLSVRLPIIRDTVELDVFLAAHADLAGAAGRPVPRLPAPVPARRQHRRRGQGLRIAGPAGQDGSAWPLVLVTWSGSAPA